MISKAVRLGVFHFGWNVLRSLGDDQKRVLHGPLHGPACRERGGIDLGHKIADASDLLANVLKPYAVRAFRHSEDPSSFALDRGAKAWMQACPRSIIQIFADGVLQSRMGIHERHEPEHSIRGWFDEDIDIGIGPGLVAGMRAEKIQRRDPETPQGRLDLLQPCKNLIAAHG